VSVCPAARAPAPLLSPVCWYATVEAALLLVPLRVFAPGFGPLASGGEMSRRCRYRQQEVAARGRSRLGGPEFILRRAFRGKASRTQAYQALLTESWTSSMGNSITLHGTTDGGSDYYILLLDVFTSRQGYGDVPITPHMSPRRRRPGVRPCRCDEEPGRIE